MKLINALNFDVPFQPKEMLGFGHKRSQRGEPMRLATLDELRQTSFSLKRRQDAHMDFHDVKSDSNSSVASSVTALKFFEFVYDDCSSLIEDDSDEDAPACSSLNLGSEDENESVDSIRIVPESAIVRRVSAH